MPLAHSTERYQQAYSEQGFWKKLARHAPHIGRQALEKALWLYYGLQNPAMPKWARRVVYGALGYFVLPLDAIPDLAPLVGYTDDIGVMSAALAMVALHIDEHARSQARARLEEWFGPAAKDTASSTSSTSSSTHHTHG